MFGLTEASVIKKAQTGDSSAIGWLFDNHHEAIFRFIWFRVQEHSLADDLTGEVFVRMVAELPRYQDRELPFRAWLYRIAHNLVIDSYRTDKSRMFLPLEQAVLSTNPASHPDEIADQTLTMERVHRALAILDPAQREVVELRFLMGLSLQDAAATLNKTVAAVKSLQHRGLSTLRILLTEQPYRPQHAAYSSESTP